MQEGKECNAMLVYPYIQDGTISHGDKSLQGKRVIV